MNEDRQLMERQLMTTDPVHSPRHNRSVPRLDRRLVAAAAVLVALAGCATGTQQDITASIPDDYRIKHPITIDEQLATMDIPVGLDAGRLSSGARGNIAGFAQRFNSSGGSLMAIVAPVGSPNEVVAASMSHQVYDVLLAAGIRPAALDFRTYRAGPKETGAPIRLAYSRIAASVADCGQWPGNLDNDSRNRNYKNFGCATQANLAAMVANPLDLLYPRASTPPDATRRAKVLEGYQNGEIYSATQRLEGGEIATGVGN
jgi:pilus assembly protein CpaD